MCLFDISFFRLFLFLLSICFVIFGQTGGEEDMKRLMYNLDPDSDENGPMYFVSMLVYGGFLNCSPLLDRIPPLLQASMLIARRQGGGMYDDKGSNVVFECTATYST